MSKSLEEQLEDAELYQSAMDKEVDKGEYDEYEREINRLEREIEDQNNDA